MRMRTVACISLIAGALAAAPCLADCVLPAPPSRLPDGARASPEEMLSAMQTMKRYNQDVNEYLQCLDFEQRRHALNPDLGAKQHNSAVEQLTKVAGAFNEQVRLFKSRHG